MNEYKVTIGETTFGGLESLMGTEGLIDYGTLIVLGLQRSKTAREALKVMTDLVATYGYASEGESFTITDPTEVFILELTGKGKGYKGAVWVGKKSTGWPRHSPRQSSANHNILGKGFDRGRKDVGYRLQQRRRELCR